MESQSEHNIASESVGDEYTRDFQELTNLVARDYHDRMAKALITERDEHPHGRREHGVEPRQKRCGFRMTQHLTVDDDRKHTVAFGSAMVDGGAMNAEEIRRNTRAGQKALSRAMRVIVRKGVDLPSVRDIPLFSADPDNPERLIRLLNGKREYGRFIKGQFQPIEE